MGERAAQRYLAWRKYRDAEKPMILLLGGATGVGKTSLGHEVAYRLGIHRIVSTDAIRQVMRIMLSPDLVPAIHASSYEAHQVVGERGWRPSMTTGGPLDGQPESLFEEMQLKTRQSQPGANNHHQNWFDCIRTRQSPSSHEEIGHRSASLGHLTIIAYKLGRSLKWDPVRELFPEDEQANRLLRRARRAPWHI